MKPLLVLLFTFGVSLVILKIRKGVYKVDQAARIALSVMLLFTAVAHFVFMKGMAMMLPSFLPYKESIVYMTGIAEILLAVGLLFPRHQLLSGKVLILFLY